MAQIGYMFLAISVSILILLIVMWLFRQRYTSTVYPPTTTPPHESYDLTIHNNKEFDELKAYIGQGHVTVPADAAIHIKNVPPQTLVKIGHKIFRIDGKLKHIELQN